MNGVAESSGGVSRMIYQGQGEFALLHVETLLPHKINLGLRQSTAHNHNQLGHCAIGRTHGLRPLNGPGCKPHLLSVD